MKKLYAFIVTIIYCVGITQAQDINFQSEYNKILFPVSLNVGGGITGDDGNYKRLTLFHGHSIAFQTGTNQASFSHTKLFINAAGNMGLGTTTPYSWFGGKVFQLEDDRPVLRFAPKQPNGLATITFKGAYNGSDPGTADEMHLNYVSSSTDPQINLSSYLNLIDGNDKSVISLHGNGSVGIGTKNPTATLEVVGKQKINNALGTNDYTSTGQHKGQIRIANGLGTYQSKALEIALLDNGTGIIQANESDVGYNNVAINPVSGNVGIGTITPNEKLSVNGNIRSKEVKVETANWPDYVFKDDYNLMPLSWVKSYIKENRHLPDIPSAAEVEKNGISLGGMNKLLTKKLEELTLHLIEKDEQLSTQNTVLNNQRSLIDRQLSMINQLEKRLETIENKINKNK